MRTTMKSNRKTRGRLAAASITLTLVAATAGCSSSSEKEGAVDQEVRVAINGTNMSDLPLQVAYHLGLYEDAGLDVSFVEFGAGSEVLTGLLSESADVGSGAYSTMLHAIVAGQPVEMFVENRRLPGYALIKSPKHTEIETPGDLKGAQVGVSAPGGEIHATLEYILAQNSVPSDSVGLSSVGLQATAVAAVENGTVAVAVMLDPAITQVLERSNAEILIDLRTLEDSAALYGTEDYVGTGLYATSSWLDENPEKAQLLAEGTLEALEWIDSHSAEEIAEILPSEIKGDEALYVEALAANLETFSLDGVVDAAGAQTVADVVSIQDEKIKDIDLETTFRNEYLQD